jgi:hypothetical protein
MHITFRENSRYLVIAALLPLLMGCGFWRPTVGPTQAETQIAANGASSAQVELTLGAGELQLSALQTSAGSSDLAEVAFTYSIASWQPTVDYNVNQGVGNLVIAQPKTTAVLPQNIRYEWDVKLNQAIPLDLKLDMGAGKAVLDLRGLTLTAVDIGAGAGELQMDLSGAWAQSVPITIKGGVGKVTLHLPKAVGVHIEATAGLGRVNADGLRKEGDAYVNAAYATSAVVLTITVEAGVGEVNLTME